MGFWDGLHTDGPGPSITALGEALGPNVTPAPHPSKGVPLVEHAFCWFSRGIQQMLLETGL